MLPHPRYRVTASGGVENDDGGLSAAVPNQRFQSYEETALPK